MSDTNEHLSPEILSDFDLLGREKLISLNVEYAQLRQKSGTKQSWRQHCHPYITTLARWGQLQPWFWNFGAAGINWKYPDNAVHVRINCKQILIGYLLESASAAFRGGAKSRPDLEITSDRLATETHKSHLSSSSSSSSISICDVLWWTLNMEHIGHPTDYQITLREQKLNQHRPSDQEGIWYMIYEI